MKIVVTKRPDDFYACLGGRPEIWAAGKTVDEVVGDLVRCHKEYFGLTIEWDMQDDWTRRYLASDRLTG